VKVASGAGVPGAPPLDHLAGFVPDDIDVPRSERDIREIEARCD